MTDLPALWFAAFLACAAATAHAADAPQAAASAAASAKDEAKSEAKDSAPADAAPPRRLKFKSRASNCLCADPITDEEIDAAAARQNEAKAKSPTPRSKP